MNKRLAWIPILILAIGGLMTANINGAGGKGGQDIEQAVGQFYSALNAMFTGDLGSMKDVWSHADDVTYMGPTGGFQGWVGSGVKDLGGTGCHETRWQSRTD